MTQLYGYAAATLEYKGLSVMEQAEICREAALERFPGGEWKGCFQEPPIAVDYLNTHHGPFMARKAGKELCQAVRAGDHVFVDLVERCLDTQENLLRTLEWFKKQGVIVHFLDFEDLVESAVHPTEWLMFAMGLWRRIRQRYHTAQIANRRTRALEAGVFWLPVGKTKPPFGTSIVKAEPPVLDEHGKPALMLIWNKEQRAFLDRIVNLYEVEKKTFNQIGIHLEASWQQPETLKTEAFHDRAVIYFYELGLFYRENSDCAARFLNLELVPRWGNVRLKNWNPRPGLVLSDEQKIERERFLFPMGWRARPCATPEERARHARHVPDATEGS